jgi:hypothetical protein
MQSLMRLNISFLACLLTALEVLLALIPMKIVAAQYAGRSALADATLMVL